MLTKKFAALLLILIMLFSCSAPSLADSQREQTNFATDPIAVSSTNLGYDEYFRNEHGFYVDNSTRITNPSALLQQNGSPLFTGQDGKLCYNGQPVTGYVGNQELLFFCVNQTIYRYHVFSKRVDEVFTQPSMTTFYPITSEKILWGSNTASGSRTAAICTPAIHDEITYHFYDVYTDTEINTFDAVELIRMTTCGPYINLRDATRYTINGKAIPHASYPAGSTWDGGNQCAGFARYIYYYLWGQYGTAYYPSATAITYANLSQTNPGARYRFTIQHSAILVQYTSTNTVWYHANWGGTNLVAVSSYSYASCQNYFGSIENYVNP